MTYPANDKLAVRRAVLTELGPTNVKRNAGKAKPLKPQARRLHKELISHRLRHHYLTAMICLCITLFLLLFIRFLPASSKVLDMSAVCLSLYMVALVVLVFGLLQAIFMSRPPLHIEEI